MSKLPFSYRFRAWLLQYWFTSFEGAMVRDVWLRGGAERERERIIKLLDENQKCRLDGGHDTQGYCFCIARQLIKGEK